MIIAAIKQLFENNTRPIVDYRYLIVSDALFKLGIVIHASLMLLFFYLNVLPLAYFNIFSTVAFITATMINRHGLHVAALFLVLVEVMIHSYLSVYYIGWESGFIYFIFLAVPLIFLNTQIQLRLKVAIAICFIAAYSILFYSYHDFLYGIAIVDTRIIHTLNYLSSIIVMTSLAGIGYFYSNAATEYETELGQTRDMAVLEANTDNLTRMLNRRAMTSFLQNISRQVITDDKGYALVMCNIDNFKEINDSHGHLYGDELLITIANILKLSLRDHDIVSRWRGGEFMMLLPETSNAEANNIISRMKTSIEHAHQINENIHHQITMSFGICHIDSKFSVEECILTADQSIYESKYNEKNHINIAW